MIGERTMKTEHNVMIREVSMRDVPGGAAYWWHCSCGKFARYWSSDRVMAVRGGDAHVRIMVKRIGPLGKA